MNITLKPEPEQFIQQKLQSGEYQPIDEVITAAFRLLEGHDAAYRQRGVETRDESKSRTC